MYESHPICKSTQMTELIELYDSLSVLYSALPSETDSEWKSALKSVLYGGELLAEEAVCYGKQQNERNRGKRKRYVRQYGDGQRVTEFSAIRVSDPRESDREYLPNDTKLPVAPESEEVLPVNVRTDEVDWAISLLAEFPAEPAADQSGDGIDILLDSERVRQARENTGRRESDAETTVLFVSDTHLGYENREKTGRGSTVPWISQLSSEETIKRITQIAMERGVDAVIHTGDILDHEVDQDTLDAVETFLEALSGLGYPVYCIIGSHDHNSVNPQHHDSINGISWLKSQVNKGHLTELSISPTPVAGGSVDAYGIPAGNVGINAVGEFYSREWESSDIVFGPASNGPNLLCLHDGFTPYRGYDADVDIDRLLAQSSVSFDCVLIGDEHRPKNQDFENGYSFETTDGTPVFYTGPAMRISEPYQDHRAFVTELTVSVDSIDTKRHTL